VLDLTQMTINLPADNVCA